jgi:hypothetical protein
VSNTTPTNSKQKEMTIAFFNKFIENNAPLEVLVKWNSSETIDSSYLIKWVRTSDICAIAAGSGNLDTLKWARENGCDWDRSVCDAAFKGGHLDILKWARKNGCDWYVLPSHPSHKNSNKIQTKLDNLPLHLQNNILSFSDPNQDHFMRRLTCSKFRDQIPGLTQTNVKAVVSSRSLLKWARKNWVPIDRVSFEAAKGGYLNVLKWSHKNSYPLSNICEAAADGGHLNVLRWARQNGCDWDELTCEAAAKGGHLDVLKWARKNGCKCYIMTCAGAAEGGHLNILKWLRFVGCEWDKWTCVSAASKGHLNVLQWARQNGCEWNRYVLEDAFKGGYLDVLDWAIANGCPK